MAVVSDSLAQEISMIAITQSVGIRPTDLKSADDCIALILNHTAPYAVKRVGIAEAGSSDHPAIKNDSGAILRGRGRE